jgi:perosamine synthetase
MSVISSIVPSCETATPSKPPETIPVAVPNIGGNEWAYIKECLDTGWVSSVGPFVDRFETEFAKYLGVKHAVVTVNGTAALHVALLVAGVRPGDEVLMPSFTFIAPANAVRYCGAWPVFVDAEEATWQMDVGQAVEFMKSRCEWRDGALWNRESGRRIGAILPVHVLGHPVDMGPLLAAAREFQVPVVEDAAESLGAAYRGRPVGRMGTLACFSFNGNKVITTGGGGMIVTDDSALATRARYLSTTAKDDGDEGVHGTVGFNYRLTNLQAAMGCAQLERLDEFVAAKRRIATRYAEAFGDLSGVTPMPEAPWARHAFWMYSVRVNAVAARCTARELRQHLKQAGIDCRSFWQPMHLSPAHAGAQVLGGDVAARLYGEVLSLPCSTGLSEADQDTVISTIRKCLAQ